MTFILRAFIDFIAVLSPKIKRPYIVILNYHSISKNDPNNSDKWSISANMFDKQMKYLVDNNAEIISLSDIENIYLKNFSNNKFYVCITFDDGFEDNYNNAIPILKKYGINNATFFIVVDSLINNFDTAWWLENNKNSKLMNVEQIKNLRNNGYEVGSHALSHQNFKNVNDNELEKELIISKKILDAKCNLNCKSIAIPFSISGNPKKEQIVKDICLKNGYNFSFLGRFGYVKNKNYNRTDLPRIPVYGFDSMKTFILKVNGKFNLVSKIYHLRKKIRYIFSV
jgi:peptidoglycan/xylan/chitin deacetylase (PgdA/CDA1 family)